VLSADRVWDEHVFPVLAGDRAVVRETCRGVFKELIDNVVEHAGASWVSFQLATTARQIDLLVSDDGRGLLVALAEKLRLSSPRDAAEEMVRRATARAMDVPTARLVLIARSADGFSISSSGVACEFDAAQDSWTVRDDGSVGAGTTIACRLKRVPSRPEG